MRVVGRLADCTWKAEEHAWLSQRNRSRLMRTEEGRRQLAEEFDDPMRPAVVLMDGRVRSRAGKDGAEQRNAEELRRLSRRTGKPIASWGALHNWGDDVEDPKMLDADEFRGLASSMELWAQGIE